MIAKAAFVAAVVGLAVPLPGVAEPPEGCRADGAGYFCEFRTTTQAAATRLAADPLDSGRVHFEVAALARSIVTLTVTFEGQSDGWFIQLAEEDGGNGRSLVLRQVPAPEDPTTSTVRDTSTHYVEVDPSRRIDLAVWPYGGRLPSSGAFHVLYTAQPPPAGEPPLSPGRDARRSAHPGRDRRCRAPVPRRGSLLVRRCRAGRRAP